MEADIEPLTSPGSRISDSEEGRDLGDMMGQVQGSEPLQNQDSGEDKQYGATSAIQIRNDDRHGSVTANKTESPPAVVRYRPPDSEYDDHDDDDDDEDTVLLVSDDRDGDIDGQVERLAVDSNGQIGRDAVAVGNNITGGEVKITDGGDGERLRCGWLGFAPPFVQVTLFMTVNYHTTGL